MALRVILFCILFLSLGCATIVNGDLEPVQIDSFPRGVEASHNASSCKTPCSLMIPREGDTSILLQSPGYKIQNYSIGRTLDPWFWGNLISFSWIGMLVDYYNGKGKRPSPQKFFVTMKPLGESEDPIVDDEIDEFETEKKKSHRPTPEEFEKTIVARPTKKDVLLSDNGSFPMGWPEKWYYETAGYRYWTIVGEIKADQTEAIVSSKEKAEKVIATEFPLERYKEPMPYQSTHMELKKINGQFQSWRIIRVLQKDATLLRK